MLLGSVAVATWRYVARRARATRDAYAALAQALDPGKPAMERSPTVGVITALPEEYNAVLALLDESTKPWVAPDGVAYVFGTLPSLIDGAAHDVVLTMTTLAGHSGITDSRDVPTPGGPGARHGH